MDNNPNISEMDIMSKSEKAAVLSINNTIKPYESQKSVIEIFEEVGKENIFIFGLTCEEVLSLYASGTYNPWDIYNTDEAIRTVLRALINGHLNPRDYNLFIEIYESLLNRAGDNLADPYFILKDLRSYYNVQKEVEKAYQDQTTWQQKAIINTACSGKFSSDRTIKEYATEIWGLQPLNLNLSF